MWFFFFFFLCLIKCDHTAGKMFRFHTYDPLFSLPAGLFHSLALRSVLQTGAGGRKQVEVDGPLPRLRVPEVFRFGCLLCHHRHMPGARRRLIKNFIRGHGETENMVTTSIRREK